MTSGQFCNLLETQRPRPSNRGEGEMSLGKALSTALGSERTLTARLATFQASASYKHRLRRVKYGAVAVSRDSYFQSNKFTWNQNGTGRKDAMKMESPHQHPALVLQGRCWWLLSLGLSPSFQSGDTPSIWKVCKSVKKWKEVQRTVLSFSTSMC